jgi:hypothetical protein
MHGGGGRAPAPTPSPASGPRPGTTPPNGSAVSRDQLPGPAQSGARTGTGTASAPSAGEGPGHDGSTLRQRLDRDPVCRKCYEQFVRAWPADYMLQGGDSAILKIAHDSDDDADDELQGQIDTCTLWDQTGHGETCPCSCERTFGSRHGSSSPP